jgi:predicted permease
MSSSRVERTNEANPTLARWMTRRLTRGPRSGDSQDGLLFPLLLVALSTGILIFFVFCRRLATDREHTRYGILMVC